MRIYRSNLILDSRHALLQVDRGWGKRLFQLARYETNLTDSALNGQQLDFVVGDFRLRVQSGPFWEIHEKRMDLAAVRRRRPSSPRIHTPRADADDAQSCPSRGGRSFCSSHAY